MKVKTNSLQTRIVVVLLAIVVTLMFTIPTSMFSYADMASSKTGVESGYDVDAVVSLSDDDTGLEVTIPVSMTKDALQAAIDAGTITLSVDRDADRPYVDEELFPNQSKGGPISEWKKQNKEDLFTNIAMEAVEEEGKVALKVTFDSGCYFYSRNTVDYSAPHNEGGAYIDICGYFNLNAANGETALGGAPIKIVPYPNFHTMAEVYADIDAMAAYDTDRYVEKFSMGKSSGGRDMPYLIVAKDKKAVSDWLDFCEAAETDPDGTLAKIEAGDYDDLKVPAMYSNIHANEIAAVDGIIDFAWQLIKEDKIDYKYLEGFTEEGEAQLKEEMGPVGEKGSVAIPDLVKDTATYLGYLKAGNRVSAKVDLEKYYDISENVYDVDEILEDVFFILVPEENVDGRTFILREAANGYDLNRDNSFQTTPETANMQKLIGTYNPVSETEFHGRVQGFQCEPCDPPHEPNFEYDLLSDHLMTGGEAIGIAAVANNTKHNSYVIPQRDYLEYTGDGEQTYWADPWDDMSTSYTPQFAMLQGTVAYTVELPSYSEQATKLVSYGIIGQSAYIADEKIDYITDQVKIFQRGVKNANSNAEVGPYLTDQYDVEGAEADIFRPVFSGEGENGNFFPEAYIIPLDRDNQKNLQAANDMMTWLTRNDVKVNLLKEDVKIGEETYPAGSMVVPMYQAKRSVANGALYDGTLINGWTILYSEGITSFNETRGFDMATITKKADYETIKAAMGDAMDYEAAQAYQEGVESSFAGEGSDVVIANVSEDAVKAVNELLADGKTVAMVTSGEYKGSFLVSSKDYQSVAGDYVLTATGVDGAAVPAQVIEGLPKVYIVGEPAQSTSGFIDAGRLNWNTSNFNYDRNVMNNLGFERTRDIAEADIILGTGNITRDAAALKAVQAGKPYIGYTYNTYGVVGRLFDDVEWVELEGAMDCLTPVTYPTDNLLTASYLSVDDDIMYCYGLGYFNKAPEGAEVLVQTDPSRTPTEGFIPTYTDDLQAGYEAFMDKTVLGFSYAGKDKSGNDIDVALFANSLDHKLHQTDDYQFITNFIYSHMLGELDYNQTVAIEALDEYVESLDVDEELAEQIDAIVAVAENQITKEKDPEAIAAIATKAVQDVDKAVADEQAKQQSAAEKALAKKKAAAQEEVLQYMKANADNLDASKGLEEVLTAIVAISNAEDDAAVDAAVAASKGNIDQLVADFAVEKAKALKVTGLKLKSKARKVTVSWKAAEGATGYDVQFKLKSAKKWSNLKTGVTGTSVKSKKLKKGKKYQFQVRPYTEINGEKVYGKWVKKAVKVK